MDSIFFLFLGHCGFQKYITFASNKKFARNCTRHHTVVALGPKCRLDMPDRLEK